MSKFERKLGKTSKYSYYVTLPKETINKYGWKERQKLVITDRGHGLLEIRDWKKR